MALGPGVILSFVLFMNFVTSDLSLAVIPGSILSLVPEIFNDYFPSEEQRGVQACSLSK